MTKNVLLQLELSTHAKLKKAANVKGMKFYPYLIAELEKVAKREDKKQ
ncbi:hypothetical protein NVP1029O_47 [Vibrio phage 1.029.O._10N.261.55.A7]|nr:hypothetical protein NVP1029O_47 [Vibrio phage 1.029.O._10N.261.55.A7]